VELHLDDRMIDASQLQIPAGESRGVTFDLGVVDSGALKLRATTGDQLKVDDEAWWAVNAPRRASVLLVTPGNEPLELALNTAPARAIAELPVEPPEFLKKKAYQQRAAGGSYDLVIYDRCRPERMPQANTLFIGRLPPAGGWSAGEKIGSPQIIDTDFAHPLMQWIELGDVILAEGTPLSVPPGGDVLIDTDVGPMFTVAPRASFEDAVLGLVFVDEMADSDGKMQKYIGTNWPIRPSFPLFVLNVLSYLGVPEQALAGGSVRPGQPVLVEAPAHDKRLSVRTPAGKTVKLKQTRPGKFNFTGTGELGIYEVLSKGKPFQRFAVNLCQAAESSIRPRPDGAIKIGYVEVAGQSGWEAVRREIWKGLVLLGLVILIVEWYIYNRRVYI